MRARAKRRFIAAALTGCALLSACDQTARVKDPKPVGPAVDSPDSETPLRLTPHRITLDNGKTFDLNIPEGFEIKVAAQGLHRVRFLAKSPDSRIFVTDMLNLTDNKKGIVYALEGFDADTGKFGSITPYLQDLRNPNSLAFHTEKNGRQWLYLALTDKLLRYEFHAGDRAPSGAPQTLATYPDHGLSYKYGGWHLTRTVVIGPDDKVYVSVGSSCNVCEEKEEIRATVSVMDLDGKNPRILARGLRNAVGMKFVDGTLFVTGMGADHLGNDRPEEPMFAIQNGAHYGWPYCYSFEAKSFADDTFAKSDALSRSFDCASVPAPYATFPAHSSPLGLEYFDATAQAAALRNYFLVALHGSSNRNLQKGYRIMRVKKGRAPEDFITGFQKGPEVFGRPADLLRMGPDAFLFSDDNAGVIYFVYRGSAMKK